MLPVRVMTHVFWKLELIETASAESGTSIGASWSFVVIAPLPNCPLVSMPQHLVAPLRVTVQVCRCEAVMSMASVIPSNSESILLVKHTATDHLKQHRPFS
jgi:hypothetical protein